MSTQSRDRQAFQELAGKYEATVDQELRKAWGIRYMDFVDQVLRFARVKDEESVLDLATGTGLIPRQIAAAGSKQQIVGLDMTYAVLATGHKQPGTHSPTAPIAFTCASALDLPFAPGSFDCVICALATHHLDQGQLLAQVHTVLKPHGRFILADVIASPSWNYPGVKAILRLAAYTYFLFTESPARAWVESNAVDLVHTEAEWTLALTKYHFSSIQVHRPALKNTWLPSGILMAGIKEVN